MELKFNYFFFIIKAFLWDQVEWLGLILKMILLNLKLNHGHNKH